jgi:hypothetical protein
MSQIQSFVTGEGPGPGPVLALAGDNYNGADPNTVAAPNGLGIIFIKGEVTTGQSFATVEVDTAVIPNTLSIVASTDVVTTNDNIITFFPFAHFDWSAQLPPLTQFAIVFSANVIGYQAGFTGVCGGFVSSVAYKASAGNLTSPGYAPLMNRDVANVTYGIGINGTQFGVFVQGLNGEAWTWTCNYQYQINLL